MPNPKLWPRGLILVAMLAGAVPARADGPTAAASAAWSRATPGGAQVGAAYLTLSSPGGDTLTGVSSPAAAKAEVHEMSMDGGVMRMRELAGGLALPPGQAVTLRPGGYHIMLMGLAQPLKQGQTVPLHLVFAKSPPVDIVAQVEGIGASGPSAR